MSSKARQVSLALLMGFAISCAAIARGRTAAVYSGLIAHEWGTFTSIAGTEGQAVEWLPLSGPSDLPSFVEHFSNPGFKFGLRGTVRMETPVLYFYSPGPETIAVSVNFRKGVITEWYPRATRVEPSAALWDGVLSQQHFQGSIAWDEVALAPGETAALPNDQRGDRYYAARQTTSTPLRVRTRTGEQREKFLFYRGVAAFNLPLAAKVQDDNRVRVENFTCQTIAATILFERRGNNVGYRISGPLGTNALLDPPELTGDIDSLARELEGVFVEQGLYQNEAQAMLETWRDSWFEEGSRLLYIVPEQFVNSVLPLTIKPAPVQTTRVFVGRLELMTAATRRAVRQALASGDNATLGKYTRFLEPILKTMLEQKPDRELAGQIQDRLNAFYSAAIHRNLR